MTKKALANAAYIYWQNKNKSHNMYDNSLGSKFFFSAPFYLLAYPEVQYYKGSIPFEKAVNHFKDKGYKFNYKTVPQPHWRFTHELATTAYGAKYQTKVNSFLCRSTVGDGIKLTGFLEL